MLNIYKKLTIIILMINIEFIETSENDKSFPLRRRLLENLVHANSRFGPNLSKRHDTHDDKEVLQLK